MDVLASRLSWRRLPWLVEVISIGVGYGVYAIIRLYTPGQRTVADVHALEVIHFEKVVGIYHEVAINQFITGKTWLEIPASYYYATLHFIITPVVLAWLFRRHQAVYAPLRSAIVIATAAALVVYATWPLSPPRYVVAGTIDTVLAHPVAWAVNGHGVSGFVNEIAAMPSLHVGWAVWCAVAVSTALRSRWRYLVWLYPLGTTLVVVATANHYLLDAVAGCAVVAVALQLCGVRPSGRVAPTVLAVPAPRPQKAPPAELEQAV
jgi:hypothetical protein